MEEHERLAWFYFWREVGERMHVHSIPAVDCEFERRHFRYTETNRRVRSVACNMFAAWFPRLPNLRTGLRPRSYPAGYAIEHLGPHACHR